MPRRLIEHTTERVCEPVLEIIRSGEPYLINGVIHGCGQVCAKLLGGEETVEGG